MIDERNIMKINAHTAVRQANRARKVFSMFIEIDSDRRRKGTLCMLPTQAERRQLLNVAGTLRVPSAPRKYFDGS